MHDQYFNKIYENSKHATEHLSLLIDSPESNDLWIESLGLFNFLKFKSILILFF